ncbi:MAG: phytoene/squalene synthase family protein [Saprospiraceae bacterium]
MSQIELYNSTCKELSKVLTNRYSSSFSNGIKLFKKDLRYGIYSIYGFVRLADEIVDTFHYLDKRKYLQQIRVDVFDSIQNKFHSNPILHSFGQVVNEYGILHEHIHSFLDSMEMDINMTRFDSEQYKKYIYGSAEVIGLFCLKVFLKDEPNKYEELAYSAKKMGSAFQKINFLRDIKSDFEQRDRIYFPGIDIQSFTDLNKRTIEDDIKTDFLEGLQGIKRLPSSSRYGVLLAYKYYYFLLIKMSKVSSQDVLSGRIRISDVRKVIILISHYLQSKFKS